MVSETEIQSLPATDRVVLCALTTLHRRGESPAQTHEIRRVCRETVTDADSAVVGTVSEADVSRSLNRLEAEGVAVERRPEARSPVGKGRPAYDLDPELVVDVVADELLDIG